VIERHYVSLDQGSMHYLRAGEGVPVIVLHASPMSALSMLPWVEALSGEFAVYAPDTAGFGQSDPLPYGGTDPEIGHYAQRVLEFATGVGLDRFLLAGTHTGSKIALEVARRAPERVAQLVMDGLGLYTVEEMADQLQNYTPPIVPVWHGGHLVEVWHRLRNMWTFWPWYRQEADRRLPDSVPDLDTLQQMAFDMLRAKPDWGLAYRAAFRYEGRPALEDLTVPAVLIAKEADPLHEHLERLGVDAPTLQVRSVANEDHLAAIVAAFDRASGLPPAPPAPRSEHRGGRTRRYVQTSQGSVHVRIEGDPAAPPLLFVHGSPGSADSFDPLIRELAADHLVIAPDTLGNGYSDPPAVAEPDIDYFAGVVAEVLEALGLSGIAAYGSHTGACIALDVAVQRPDLVASVVADGLPSFDEALQQDLLENYFISLAPERHGEHLVRAWHTLRDVQLWWPWYRQDDEHRRPTGPSSPEDLHRLTLEFIKSGDTYKASYAAAFRYPSADRLALARVPVLVCASPTDMLREGSGQLGDRSGVVFVELDEAVGRDAAWAVRHQRESLGGR
jgi:pimeloyl-ACP methyl ester carboxylesterase